MTNFGLDPFIIKHLSIASEKYKEGHFARVTTAIQEITGEQPLSLEEFIRKHTHEFSKESIIQ